MNQKKPAIYDLALTITLLVLVLGPVGLVAKIGGLPVGPSEKGVALGAELDNLPGTLAELRQGKLREITFTTFWGKVTTYRDILRVVNESQTEKQYQLEVLDVRGEAPENQTVKVVFEETETSKITLPPGEEAWVELEVAAPFQPGDHGQTQSTLKLALWEN